MGKKRCWFAYMRRLFSIPKTKPKSKEDSKKWRWFLEMFKSKHAPALEAPEHPWKMLNEATQEQRKHALAVAVATAAAAEAAVAAANAATEVVRLTNKPYELEKKIKYLAALRIQCAYRGHLARKALSALKGLVKLQAVIRGMLVRRKVVNALASLMFPDSKLQPLMRKKRAPSTLSDFLYNGEGRPSISQREVSKSGELKLQRSWDLSLVSKDEIEARYLQKQEAVAKRERMKQYSYSHRELRNDQIIRSDAENRKSRRSHRCEEAEKLKPFFYCSDTIFGTGQLTQLKLKDDSSSHEQETSEVSNSSPFSQPRRSFCYVKQKSIRDTDGSLPSSPVFPTYMAATKSASAKSRSLNTPRQRLRLYSSEHSIDGQVTKRKSITQLMGTLN